MNNDIKEILDDLKIKSDRYNHHLKYNLAYENKEEDYKAKILLDYITNLQEENKRLRSKIWQIKDLKQTWLDVKENDMLVFDNNNLIDFMNRLQNILQGDNNDSK